MKRLSIPLVFVFLLYGTARCQDVAKVSQNLQDISVTIRAARSEGSGVLKVRDGVTYVWTAGHVVDDLRSTRDVIDAKSGTKKTVVEFQDAKVVKQLVEDGRTVGRVEFDAEVVRFSDSHNGHDLALLRVRKKNFSTASAVFYLDDAIPPIGTELYHVGSLLGQFGSNSMTTGIVSQIGRIHEKQIYDQLTVSAFPGSSGGGVFLKDGRYMAMLVRGSGETFNLAVPVRRMRVWAKSAGVEWAINDGVPVPSEEELRRLPIDDAGVTFESSRSDSAKSLKFLIRPIGDE